MVKDLMNLTEDLPATKKVLDQVSDKRKTC